MEPSYSDPTYPATSVIWMTNPKAKISMEDTSVEEEWKTKERQ